MVEHTERYGRVLIIDDDEDVLKAARLFLKRHVQQVQTERLPERIPQILAHSSYDVILLDMNFTKDMTSGGEGFYWLRRIMEIDPEAVVILITAFGDMELAVRSIKEGAIDFITKPWQNEKLLATVAAALALRKSRAEVAQLQSQKKMLSAQLDQHFHDFIGNSPGMKQVFQTIEKVAATDANVLILGENGTGKELVARSLHRLSARSQEVFIGVDMGAVSENLFESELFGHVRGAFTDAKSERAGRLEAASRGTLFLDEIGNLSLPMQAKILRALEERQIVRLGSNQPVPVDIRLLCASNLPIHDLVSRGEFRQDLLYRINTVEIALPPLRERVEDIPLLITHFMSIYCRKYGKKIKRLSPSTLKKLQQYRWPGNIRELRHALERAVIMSDSELLQPEDFLFPNSIKTGQLCLETFNLEELEKAIIGKALDKHGGNVSRAAQELGLTRAALYRRMEKYGI